MAAQKKKYNNVKSYRRMRKKGMYSYSVNLLPSPPLPTPRRQGVMEMHSAEHVVCIYQSMFYAFVILVLGQKRFYLLRETVHRKLGKARSPVDRALPLLCEQS
jgi:hypothetical protein